MQVVGLLDVPWWVLLPTAVIGLLWYLWPDVNYFRRQGIPCDPSYPIIGSLFGLFSKPLPYIHQDMIRDHGDQKCVGGFMGSTPQLNILDEDMLAEICVKQFTAFTNRLTFKSGSPINDLTLLNLEDAHWKNVRTVMTPSFTSGKLKKMNDEINRCSLLLADSLLEEAKKGGEVEVKEFTGGFSMDVIASVAFGIRVNSQKDRNNDFVRYAKKHFDAPHVPPLMVVLLLFPKFAKFLVKMGVSMDLLPKDVRDFFENITRQTIDLRKSDSDQSRADFIQLMVKAQRGESISDGAGGDTGGTGLTTDEILANALLFFIAGYDTTATSLGFFLYNMAVYPDIQDQIMDEINEVVGDEEDVDATALGEMPFLDKCVNESLRLYAPLLEVNRIAREDTTIKGVFIKKGTYINIPINAIHRDPRKWPDPDHFDPERFSAENKKNRNPYTFLPFGLGPRICIGMRLAIQELKVAIIQVLRKVKVTKSDKTQIPIVFDMNPSPQLMKPKDGICLKVVPREAK